MFLDTDKLPSLYLDVQYSANNELKDSTVAQYWKLLSTYKHKCTAKVFG